MAQTSTLESAWRITAENTFDLTLLHFTDFVSAVNFTCKSVTKYQMLFLKNFALHLFTLVLFQLK